MRTLLLLAFTTLLCTCGRAQKTPKPWTTADAANYAHRANDSTTWDQELFAGDLEWADEMAEHPLGINGQPSPVPAYDWGYVSSTPFFVEIAGKRLAGHRLAYAYDDYRPNNAGDTSAYYFTAATLLFLTDSEEQYPGTDMIVSRNAPHYLATGQMATSIGPIEWVQMNLADGDNFAIIAQRYFDLKQGRTIVVSPKKDGSLRFLQLDYSTEGVRSGKEHREYNKAALKAFKNRLTTDDKLLELLRQTGNL